MRIILYFEPFEGDDATGLVIEESETADGPWVEIDSFSGEYGEIGEYPDWITSVVSMNATSLAYWFRITWEADGILQIPSEAFQISPLPERWMVPDLLAERTRITALAELGSTYQQILIDLAYFMLQDACGPYDETAEDFPDRAMLASQLLVERLFYAIGPDAFQTLVGVQEEEWANYRYKMAASAPEAVAALSEEIPSYIRGLVCPFSVDKDTTSMITTVVFGRPRLYRDDSGFDVEERILTQRDIDRNNRLGPHRWWYWARGVD